MYIACRRSLRTVLMPSDFPIITTTIDTTSEQFIESTKSWSQVLEKHEKAVKWCVSEGQDKYVKRHIERGMLLSSSLHCLCVNRLARDRIRLLLDPDTPFLELCIFAGYKQPGSSPCASVVAGIGIIRYDAPIG